MPVLKLSGTAPLLDLTLLPTSWAPTEIDLTELTWATPFDVAALATLWMRSKRRPSILLPDDPDVRAYLVDVGLDEFIPASWESSGASLVEPPFLRLTRLTEPEEWDDLASVLIGDAHEMLSDPAVTRGVFAMLSELLDNAATHGASEAGVFVCAQRYTGRTSGLPPGVWVGIADAGRGIPGHLRLNPRFAEIEEDGVLIRRAREPWVTGTRDRRGWGLVEVFDEVRALVPSEVLIRSARGEGSFRLRPGASMQARYRNDLRPAVPGTWVHVRVATP